MTEQPYDPAREETELLENMVRQQPAIIPASDAAGIEPGMIRSQPFDLVMLSREQAAFIKAQTAFLTQGKAQTSNERFLVELTGYSHAQGRYIAALTRVLEQLGVV